MAPRETPMNLTRLLMATALCGVPSIAAAQAGEGDPQTLEMHANAGWTTGFFGYVRAGYESVANDPNYAFVGQNDGFILHHARLGHQGHNAAYNLSYQVSFEGAADFADGINTPQGHLDVRLRDAFMRWDPSPYVGVQVGQFRAPLIGEELRGNAGLLFVGRAVGIDGVATGRGFQQAGLAVDRQVGVMLSPAKPITIAGDVSASYFLMAANGNGANQTLDDNGKPAFVGRVEINYGDLVTLGGGAMLNPRTEGDLPNLIEEDDLTIAADLLVTVAGAEVFGQFVQRTTSFETIGATEDRKQQSIHAQIGYEIPTCIPLVPAYRFAMFNPWASGGDSEGADLEALKLTYHTVGLRVIHPQRELGLSLYLNYTLTGEETARELENDRFEALVQLLF
jgi:hypothetical protein